MTYPRDSWVDRALDGGEWRANQMRTDIAYAVEYGYAFIGSSRWTVDGLSTDYVQVTVPENTVMRLYNRIVAVDGGSWELDVLEVSDITQGDVLFNESCLNCEIARDPTVEIRRGATNPSIIALREQSLIPGASGPRADGSTIDSSTFRRLNGKGVQLAIRVTNNDVASHTMNMTFIWTEEVPLDN